MKVLKLGCVDCGKSLVLCGKDVDEIIRKIEESDWHDFPTKDGIGARCPPCEKQYQLRQEIRVRLENPQSPEKAR